MRRVDCQQSVWAQRGMLPSHKGTGCCVSASDRNGPSQGLGAEEGRAMERGRSSRGPSSHSSLELHVLGRGYRMTSRELFTFMKNEMGMGGRDPARVGWENTKIYANAGFTRAK